MSQNEQKRREKGVPGGRSKTRGPTFGAGIKSWWMIFLPALCAVWAYHDALDGKFVFDDVPTVQENASLTTLGGFWDAAFGPKHSPISNRPVVCLTFAINYLVGGLEPRGYHAFNLAVHAVNAILLVLVLRRTLIAPNLGDAFTPGQATWFATGIAAVWAVHPLGVDAVTYVTQRTTLIMSFFILLTLYGTLRSATDDKRPGFWKWFAVAMCALAMMSKEESAALPILVVLFDRAFLYDSFESARNKRTSFYGALAGTWLLLIACVMAGPRNPTVGYGAVPSLNALEWLMTEARVIVQYLRLSFWPSPLIAAYDWPFVRSLPDVLWQGLVVLALLGATIGLWFWRPRWAWLGAMFFLLLAPTSSIMPIVSEAIAERRMYLPMLAVLIPALLGVFWIGERVGRALFGLSPWRGAWLALPLAAVVFVEARETARYARVFDNDMTLWSDVVAKNELKNRSFMSGSILMGYAKPWLDQGRYDKAVPLLEEAVQCEAPTVDILVNMAAAYVDIHRYDKAEEFYQRAFASDPNHANALSNYGKMMLDLYQNDPPEKRLGPNDPRMLKAYDMAKRAITINPRNTTYFNNFGSICYHLGRVQEADQAWLTALQLDPNNIGAAANRAAVLAQSGRVAEAIQTFEAIYAANPQHDSVLINLVQAYLRTGNKQLALQRVQNTLSINPNHATARALLKELTATP